MDEKNDSLRIDLEKVIRDKNPRLAKTLPRFVIAYLKRIIHQDEINRILTAYAHLDSIPFIRAAFVDMGISYQAVGIERLADDGRYLFVSNHPFGGMDGLMLCDEIYKRFGKVHIIVNDLLMYLTPAQVALHSDQQTRTTKGRIRPDAQNPARRQRSDRHLPGRTLLEKNKRSRTRSRMETEFYQKCHLQRTRHRTGIL